MFLVCDLDNDYFQQQFESHLNDLIECYDGEISKEEYERLEQDAREYAEFRCNY